ncbi:uncharacterized protein LOC144453673 [Glandiceps talaboti]
MAALNKRLVYLLVCLCSLSSVCLSTTQSPTAQNTPTQDSATSAPPTAAPTTEDPAGTTAEPEPESTSELASLDDEVPLKLILLSAFYVLLIVGTTFTVIMCVFCKFCSKAVEAEDKLGLEQEATHNRQQHRGIDNPVELE